MPSISTRSSGDLGEDYALHLLKEHGYEILDRNFYSKYGEIDIVAQKDGVLVFVEVKTRWTNKYGLPEEAVTPGKLKKIIRTGDYYIKVTKNRLKKRRVDVVAIQAEKKKIISAKIIKVL